MLIGPVVEHAFVDNLKIAKLLHDRLGRHRIGYQHINAPGLQIQAA